MYRLIWSIACGAALLVSSPRPAHAATPAQVTAPAAEDKVVADRVESRLKADAALKKFDIDVTVTAGVAKLSGKVATAGEKARAERLAHVAGVKRVDNAIEVSTSAAKGTTGTVVDKSKAGIKKAGDDVSDAYILTRIKSRFIGVDTLKGSDINVDVDKHIVTLKGTVPSEAGRARAIAIAKDTEGVRSVVDQLTVK